MTKAGVGYFLSRRPESERAEQPDA
jgi:hypothetical protein